MSFQQGARNFARGVRQATRNRGNFYNAKSFARSNPVRTATKANIRVASEFNFAHLQSAKANMLQMNLSTLANLSIGPLGIADDEAVYKIFCKLKFLLETTTMMGCAVEKVKREYNIVSRVMRDT